jgi:crossover junction endodeoxyribonuclease RuvC
MGHARGVILALAARRAIGVIHIASTHVKKFLTGSGHAGKAQIQRAVATTLGLPRLPEPHDVADAIAIALCGQYMRRGQR